MFGKTTPPSKVPGSSWVNGQLNEIRLKTGPPSRITLNVDGSILYRTTYSLRIIGPSERLLLTMLSLLQSNERLKFTGVQLESGSLDEHGQKLVSMHIPSVLSVNSGTDTELIHTLSLMSTVEVLTSVISSDGSTDTLFVWTLRDRQQSFLRRIFGSLPTCIQETGTLI